MGITLIYLENEVLFSKKTYTSWQDIQAEYEGYITSMGPWSTEDIIDFLSDEYPRLQPDAETQLAQFLQASQESVALSFEA